MDWTTESILRFLRLYKMHPCLWDTKQTKLHRNRDRVYEAWLEVQKNMNIPCTIPQLKKKKESLMSAYRAYKTKIKNSTSVGGGTVYKPSWFAFATMDSFLSTVYLGSSTSTCNRRQSENEQSTENTDARIEDQEEDQDCNPRKIRRPNSPDIAPQEEYIYCETSQEVNDECSILAKLWARKIRKLPEDRRDSLIYKINNLVYKECVENHRQSPPCIIPSPVQIFKEESMSDSSKDEPGSNGYNISVTEIELDES